MAEKTQADAFASALKEAGCAVQRGSLQELDCLKMASEGKLVSCFGNNAGSYYLVVFLPPAPNQDPAPAVPARGWPAEEPSALWDESAENFPANPYFSPVGWTWKLRADEAVVLMGELPPACKYFSLINYVLLTQVKGDKDYAQAKGFFQVPSAGGVYHPVFGSLGLPRNQFNFASSLTPGGAQGSRDACAPMPWGGRFVYVMCGDEATQETVRAVLAAAGVDPAVVNESPLPAASLNMGLEAGKDTFTILGRVSQPEDPEATAAWSAGLASSMDVFRVTPAAPPAKARPIPMGVVTTRGTGIHEVDLVPHAKAALDAIRSELIAAYAGEFDYEEPEVRIAVPEGMTGYLNDANSQGDNHDAAYLMTEDFTFGSDEDFAVIYGVNHTASGKAVYSNAILYARPMLNGVCSVYDGLFEGSAAPWLSGCPEADPASFYVCTMARAGSAAAGAKGAVATVPYSTGNEQGRFFGTDNGAKLILASRAYVERETGVGPSYYEICYDRVLVFHKR